MDEEDRRASSDAYMASATKTGSTQSSEGESDTNISAASPSPFQTLLMTHREKIEGPYNSPQIKLIVGPQGNQHALYAHKDILCKAPYFKACLQKDAFIEGQTNTIELPEEDPLVFPRLLEWLYSKSCFPCWDDTNQDGNDSALQPYIQRLVYQSPKEPYKNTGKDFAAITNGSSTSTDETFALFQVVVLTMCAAERFCMSDLQQYCLLKLKQFPIGAKEVAILAQHILTNIPQGQGQNELYEQLQKHISCQRTRLPHSQILDSFFQNENFEAAKEYFKMVNIASSSGLAKKIEGTLDGKLKVNASTIPTGIALCTRDVNVQDMINKYGSDADYALKFGSAKVGDIFINDGAVDQRGIIRCWQGMSLLGDDGNVQERDAAAYPSEHFRLLRGSTFIL